MNEIMIPLNHIDPNPFQPRTSEDAEHICALAESILREDLLQIPVGRNVSGLMSELNVQLAFGHSRLAAFKLLVSEGHHEFRQMPVSIKPLTDQQMFEYAVTENVTRKNLTPIEEAIAMQRYRDEFGKTSAEIGALFGISDSTVRNKLRLLDLPEVAQEKLKTGELGEANARRLLTLNRVRPDKVEEIAAVAIEKDMTPTEIETEITETLLYREASAERMWAKWNDQEHPMAGKGLWPLDWEPTQSGMVCTSCPQYLRLNGNHLCCDKVCFNKKKKEWCQKELARLSDEMGIPAYDSKADGKTHIIQDWSNKSDFDKWMEAKDPGLRLKIKYRDNYPYHLTNNRCVQLVSVNTEAVAAKLAGEERKKQESDVYRSASLMRKLSDKFLEEAAQFFATLIGNPKAEALVPLIHLAADNAGKYGFQIPAESTIEEKMEMYRYFVALELVDENITWEKSAEGPVAVAAHLKKLAAEWGVDLPADWEEMAQAFEKGEGDGND